MTAAGRRKWSRRRLWGNGHGRFRTRGRHGTATVRGTCWLTEDRCDGTLVRVKRGLVEVRDLERRKTVMVPAGESYLAKSLQCRRSGAPANCGSASRLGRGYSSPFMNEQFADLGEITLCYETFGDPGDPTILLIMGLGTQMLGLARGLLRRAGRDAASTSSGSTTATAADRRT